VRTTDRIFVIKTARRWNPARTRELLDKEDGLYRMLCELQLNLS